MHPSKPSLFELLFRISKEISLEDFNEYLMNLLDRKADELRTLREIDERIAQLQNFISLVSIFIKHKLIICCLEPKPVYENRYYTRKEIADLYQVNIRTVANWVKAGLEEKRVGGILRIEEGALNRFIQTNQTKKFSWKSICPPKRRLEG